MQLDVDQVYLRRLGWVGSRARAMLDRLAQMRVALDTQASQEPDAVLIGLVERVRPTAHRHHDPAHRLALLPFLRPATARV